jgi:hypothetical protein
MYRRKHRDKMIFESTYMAFSWVGTMIVGGNVVNFRWGRQRFKKCSKESRRFVVSSQMSNSLMVFVKESKSIFESKYICRGSLRLHRFYMDIAM